MSLRVQPVSTPLDLCESRAACESASREAMGRGSHESVGIGRVGSCFGSVSVQLEPRALAAILSREFHLWSRLAPAAQVDWVSRLAPAAQVGWVSRLAPAASACG